MDFTQLLKELEAEKQKGISGLYTQLKEASKENADIMSVFMEHFVGKKKTDLTEIQKQLLKELEAEKQKGISGLYTQLEKASKENADIMSALKEHFVADEENNEKEEDSK